MRVDADEFVIKNIARAKEPRYTIEQAFDFANTDLHYITSHADSQLPVGAVVLAKQLANVSGTTQRIDPDNSNSTIGRLSYTVTDKDAGFTDLVKSKLDGGDGLRGRRVAFYFGYKGLIWDDVQAVQTQIIDDVSYDPNKNEYQINCVDVQRFARKKIFVVKQTQLSADLTDTATSINVFSTTGFLTVEHGTSYSDAPGSTVGYVKIEDEIIRYTGTTSTSFTGCTRGVLRTIAASHESGNATSNDRKKVVEEYVYLEMPAIMLARALYDGVVQGQSGTLPAHWHAGFDISYLNVSEFTGIGTDLWDITDDTKGFPVFFEGVKNEDAKTFIEKELFRLVGVFPLIHGDGTLGIKRLGEVGADASPVKLLNKYNIFSVSNVKHNMGRIYNVLEILWNWDELQERYTRNNIIQDTSSQTLHGVTPTKRFEFRGLHGSIATENALNYQFNSFRDRYSGPPIEMDVECLPSLNDLEVGDIVSVELDNVRDFNTGTTLSRSYEIQNVSINWKTGRPKFKLFGSTQKAAPLALFEATTVLNDSAYVSSGTELAAYLTANYPGQSNVSGGTLFITGSVTLPGNADMTAASARYYYDGPLETSSGATVNYTLNAQVWCKGLWENKGDWVGKGNGYPSTLFGTPGFVGNAAGDFGTDMSFNAGLGTTMFLLTITEPNLVPVIGTHSAIPILNLTTDGDTISGIPSDIRGTVGPQGGRVNDISTLPVFVASGGNPGASGAGLVVVSRGALFSGSGSIDASGDDGQIGTARTIDVAPNDKQIHSGTGAGGCAGGIYFIQDGSNVNIPSLSNGTIRSKKGAQATPPGFSMTSPGSDAFNVLDSDLTFRYYNEANLSMPDAATEAWQSTSRVQFLQPSTAPEADADYTNIAAPVLAPLVSGESALLPQGDGTVVSRIKVAWTLSTSENVKGYRVRWKLSSDAVFNQFSGLLSNTTTDTFITDVKDNTAYDVEVIAISQYSDSKGTAFESPPASEANHIVIGRTAPPDDVNGFVAAQTGTVAVFRWIQVSNIDLSGYTIRYGPRGASTFDDATPLTEVTKGTGITTADLPPGDWTAYCKAVDTTGNVSVTAAQDDILFVNVFTLVEQNEQAPDWLGTKTGYVKHWTGVLVPDDLNLSSFYTNFEDLDEFVINPVANPTYDAPEIDIDFDDTVRVWGSITSALGPGELTGVADPDLHLDYRLNADPYDGFETWIIGNREARFIKLRISDAPVAGKVKVTGFLPTIDKEPSTQQVSGLTVSVGGSAVVFPTPYHSTPVVTPIATGSVALIPVADTVTSTGFTFRIFNSGGTDVGGTGSYVVEGV